MAKIIWPNTFTFFPMILYDFMKVRTIKINYSEPMKLPHIDFLHSHFVREQKKNIKNI